MDDDKLYFIISIPKGFKEKFHNFLVNINATNSDREAPVKIEGIYIRKYSAVPKKPEEDENGQ